MKRVVFKVNRPSYQTKSNIVEKTFDKQKEILIYFVNNRVPDGLQVMNLISGYIGSIIKEEEAKPILEGVNKDYAELVREYCNTMKIPEANLSETALNQLYSAAWLKAYHKANDIFDRIYRGRGNELRIGCIVEDGETPDGKPITIMQNDKKDDKKDRDGEEILFDDIDSVEDESTEIDIAAATGGTSLISPPSTQIANQSG